MVPININLKKGYKNREMAERFVQVGYGHVNAKELLDSVSSVNKSDFDFTMYSHMYDLIQGQFPGVMVENGQIIVRGDKTFSGAEGNAVLLVIDGSITNVRDFANLSPFDVQSIDILKDGPSSAYCSHSAHGVVIV